MVESTLSPIDKEIEELEELIGDNIRSYADKSCRIQLTYTEIKSCYLIFKYPVPEEGTEPDPVTAYPNSLLHIELKSKTIPEKLLGLLLKRLEQHAATLLGKPQGVSVYQFFDNILENNNLIPCWSEFAQIKKVIDPKRGDELKTFEKLGKLKVTLKEGTFKAVAEFVIPPSYPMQSVKFVLKEHNFDPIFAQIFESHTQNIIRRLWSGGPPGYDRKVDTNSDKVGFKRAVGGLAADMERIKMATRSELKHDMDFLKKQAELRNGTMDKQDRRAFKLNLKHEKRYEEEMSLKAEEEKKASQSLDDHGQMNRVSATPQVYHAINYLANFFVRFLPTSKCPCCDKKLVTKLKEGKSDEMMPERAFCGHWVHTKCFEEFVHTKPFKRPCPTDGCEEILASPAFPCDPASVKNREKKWVQEEARLGEKDDLDKLFGF